MEKMEVFVLDICFVGGLLWISRNSQSYKWGATLDLVKIEILESRGYFGLGGGLLWRGATLDRSSLTVQTVCTEAQIEGSNLLNLYTAQQ